MRNGVGAPQIRRVLQQSSWKRSGNVMVDLAKRYPEQPLSCHDDARCRITADDVQ